MSSTPRPIKRPRLNNSISASTLRAPFKSPLRPRDSNAPAASPTLPHKNAFSATAQRTVAIDTDRAGASIEKNTHALTRPSNKIDHGPPTTTTNLEAPDTLATGAAPGGSGGEDLASLQRTHTRLLNTLAASKRNLENATQAHKLESSSYVSSTPSSADASSECAENQRLIELIALWKSASRDAADVVFVSAKERVEGMGGVKGLRRREVERWEWSRREERAERDGEMRREKRERGGDGEEEAGDDGEGGVENEEGDDPGEKLEEEDEGGGEYTMGMMLQGFGINPKSIGWDEAGGRWID